MDKWRAINNNDMRTLNRLTKAALVISALALLAVLIVPIWRIELNAPQYPEGLVLKIYANGLRGDVDIINGLNHYIGMSSLHSKDFVEFTLLPYIIVFYAILFIAIAVINKKRWVTAGFVLFVLFGVIAMIDFWRWEYNYGHNLNPNAAIVVPGMAYQPPLIGFKQLLNFGAYSVPGTGGWLFVAIGLLLCLCVITKTKKKNPAAGRKVAVNIAKMLALCVCLSSCHTAPEPIRTGVDNCSYCKMRITDARFGAELITAKGKVYKFDDIHCILSFIKEAGRKRPGMQDVYLVDFAGDHSLVKASEGFMLQSDDLRAPMNGNIVAFKSRDSLQKIAGQLKGEVVNWNTLVK